MRLKKPRNISNLLGGLIGGTVGGIIGALVIDGVVLYVGEPLQKTTYQAILIVFWGALLGLGVAEGYSLVQRKGRLTGLLRIICGAMGATFAGAFGGELISGALYGGGILGGIFGGWILLAMSTSKIFARKKSIIKDVFFLIIGGVLGGGGTGVTSGLLWGFWAKGDQAEGYVLLVTAMLIILSIIWGIGIILGMNISDKTVSLGIKKLTGVGVIVVVLCIGVGIQTIVGFRDKHSDAGHAQNTENANPPSGVLSNYDISTIIELIKRKIEMTERKEDSALSELTALYTLTKDPLYASKVKEILLKESRENKFTDPAHSVKSKQLDAAKRAVSYLEIKNVPGLFSPEEKEELIDWFKNIVERVFSVEWVDYLYALAFGRAPVGPYENQEIGVAALAVFAQVIGTKYPEIAQKCRDYIDVHAVVWGGNFRNTDDSIGYQSWWIYSAFLVAKYRPTLEWLTNDNARKAFEWILKQWPPNGMRLAYNDYDSKNIADTLALGAALFHDGRYKWLAVKMLQQLRSEEELPFPFYFGLASWDDSLSPVKPTIGSSYLVGPGEFPHNPGPSMPDKIVFREGWEEDSLYALLNLRYSGWHKYKATNSIINIIYGKPFVVEDVIRKTHNWLPAGRAFYRDKKIDRIRLNGFQIGLEGYERLIHDLLQMSSPWAQDPPQYAGVGYFQTTPQVEFSKTSLSNWRDWSHERVSILVKNAYFAVFDKAEGAKKGRVAINWHLKGKSTIEPESICLEQDEYRMNVYYPHAQEWYQVKIENSSEEDLAGVDINAPDLDLYMLSEGTSKAGFMTLFAPQRDKNHHIVSSINVKDSENRSSYPDALGIKVEHEERKDTVGVAFLRNVFTYGPVRTDTELFVLREESHRWLLTYKDGSFFEIHSPKKPRELTIDTQILKENVDWSYSDRKLNIRLPKGTGEVRVKYL